MKDALEDVSSHRDAALRKVKSLEVGTTTRGPVVRHDEVDERRDVHDAGERRILFFGFFASGPGVKKSERTMLWCDVHLPSTLDPQRKNVPAVVVEWTLPLRVGQVGQDLHQQL